MSKELEALKQSTDTGNLQEKMEEVEVAKTEVEAQLVQRVCTVVKNLLNNIESIF